MQKTPSPRRQSGITLMESLVAIVVAALGVLGILGSQLRTLADTQTSVHRAQAIRLIEDLSERMRANPNARLACPGSGPSCNINDLYWVINDWKLPLPTGGGGCSAASPCNPRQLARYDMQQWRQSVANMLPQGDAKTRVFNESTMGADRQAQLMVLVAWRENEKEGTKADAINYIAGTSEICPKDKTCHVQYISIATRCHSNTMDGKLICP